ncbi:MAG: methylmalonyl Co-A mutase-associated GTPase MeaB [Vicinamibacterales bacterium]|jgi:LAO/AO transport system kinase
MPLTLAERVRSGDVRAIARAISLIEDEAASAAGLVRDIFPHTGRTYLVGVTGPPGAGKSTLVDRLTTETRAAGETVGVICVDPTSPFTGGAILGDRLRMQAHAQDDQVFIRSMATRGHMGGLARATSDAALVLDAAGKSLVIIETVGVGQDEVDIVRTADVSIVVLVPGTGDDVQALKAGIMEIADIFVVNKCDREGADRMVTSIESNLALQAYGEGEWRPPIVKTEATTGRGVAELWATVRQFRAHSEHAVSGSPANVASGFLTAEASAKAVSRTNRLRRLKARNEFRLRDLLTHRFMEMVEQELLGPGEFEALVARIAAREVDPYTAASDILLRALRPKP